MKIIRTAALMAAGGLLLAGCGQNSPTPTPTVPAAATAPTAAAPVLDGPCPTDRVGNRTVLNDPVLVCAGTSTGPRWILSTAEPVKVELVTTTTTCQATAVAAALQAAQSELDSLIGGRRQAESAVAQIQLTIDNAGRQIDQYRRNQADAQKIYDQAAATYADIKWDTYHDKMMVAADNLADWKGIVASWEAVRNKARGDLSLGKATLGDWDKRIAETQQAVTTTKAAQNALTCS